MIRRLLLPALLATSLLSGCANFGHRPDGTRPPPTSPYLPPSDSSTPLVPPDEISETRRIIVLEALGQVGRPYHYGGTTPEGFDCSGLARYVYEQAGINLPRSTGEQHAFGETITLDEAQPGDLLFYRFSRKAQVDHVAIYLGEGKAVHAPVNGKTVLVASVDDPVWIKRFVDVVRVIP